MKIALAVAEIKNGDKQNNLAQIERCIAAAQKENARLVCFGETVLQGFDALCWDFEKDKTVAVSVNSDEIGRICRMSEKYGVDVLFGYVERDGDALYSAAALIVNGRLHHNYRRISKGWKEYTKTDEHYKEGDAVEVFSYQGKTCAIALCGDLWDHPERFDLGEDLLFWPVYVSWTKEAWEKVVKAEYAAQAGKCCPNTLYVNSICEDDAYGSAAFFEKGRVKDELRMGREGLLLVEV